MNAFLIAGLVYSQSVSPLDDPLLAKVISVRADALPIHTTLDGIAKQTGAKIYANSNVGQDRIILLANNLPAKDILKKISDHYGWSWRPARDGIELWQTPAQASEDKRMLQETILKPLRKWRQASIDALRSRQGFDSKKGWVRFQEVAAAMTDHFARYDEEYYGTPEQRKSWSSKRAAFDAEMGDIGRKLSPSWLLCDTIVAGLTDNDLLQIATEGRLVVAYAPKGGQRPMSRMAQGICEEVVKFISGWNATGTLEHHMGRSLGVESNLRTTPEAIRNVRLHLKSGGLSLQVDNPNPVEIPRLFVVDDDFQIAHQAYLSPYEPRPNLNEQPKPPVIPPDELDQPLPQTDALKAALAPVGQRRMIKAVEEAQEQFFTAGGTTFFSAGHARILNEVATAAGFNFIGDCYDWSRYGHSFNTSFPTARHAFRSISSANRVTWNFANGWVNFRDPNRAAGRACSIPSDKLLLIRDQMLGAFTLDSGGVVASLVNDFQVEGSNLQRWFANRWGMSLQGDSEILTLLRFWGTMSAGAKQNLLKGNTVALSSIGRPSLGHLVKFFQSQERPFNSHEMEFGENGDAEDYRWVKENWPMSNTYSTDWDLSEHLPNGPGSNATITLRRSQGTAFKVMSKEQAGWSMTMAAHRAIGSGYYRDDFEYNILSELRNFFSVNFAPNTYRGFLIKGFGVPGEKVYSIGTLPEDLRKKLDADIQKRKSG